MSEWVIDPDAAVREALQDLKREAEAYRAMCDRSADRAKTDMIAMHVIGEAVGVYQVIKMIDNMLARIDGATDDR